MNKEAHPSRNISNYLILLRRFVYGAIHLIYKILPPLKNNIVVLNYHGIGNNPYRFDVTEENFKAHIQYLLAQGYTFISVAQLQGWLKCKHLPNGLYALLTFDDGNRSVLKVRSLLKESGIRPAIFVLTESEHTDRSVLSPEFEPMTTAELLAVKNEGWEVGGHTATHLNLPLVTEDAKLISELSGSKQVLEKILGTNVDYFAYPHGRYDTRVINAAIEAGYTIAFSTDEEALHTETNRYVVPRVGINKTHSLTEFKAVITPFSLWLKPFIKRFYE
jgi:peptidoglycan/xylan/chitin deacetylase (PgdA/CDA1 family)